MDTKIVHLPTELAVRLDELKDHWWRAGGPKLSRARVIEALVGVAGHVDPSKFPEDDDEWISPRQGRPRGPLTDAEKRARKINGQARRARKPG